MVLHSKLPDFSGETFFIGIDTHKANWKVSIRTRDVHLKTYTTDPSPQALHKHMCDHYPNGKYVSVYEAGFCGYWIHRQLTDLNFKNIIVNPSDVPSTNKERDRKSDPIDSAKLSRERANNSLSGIYVPDVHHESMRSLNRLYKQNTRRMTQIKNRIKGYLHFTGTKIPEDFNRVCWSNNFLTYLSNIQFADPIGKIVLDTHLDDLKHARKTRSAILRQIHKTAKDVPVIQLLITVPGVGLLTAFSLYAELVDINRFKNLDNLASYIGLVPSTQSSDATLTVNGISNRHCQHLRSALIESAWIATRNDPALLYSFNELAKKMKKTDAIIRIARKLVNRIRYVWKNNKPYVTGTLEVSKSAKPK